MTQSLLREGIEFATKLASGFESQSPPKVQHLFIMESTDGFQRAPIIKLFEKFYLQIAAMWIFFYNMQNIMYIFEWKRLGPDDDRFPSYAIPKTQ